MRSVFLSSILLLAIPVVAGCVAAEDRELTDQVSQEVVPPPTPCVDGLVTRTQGFWKNHSCVVKGEATGYSLLPITLGAGFLLDKPADVEDYLDTPPMGDKQIILGHQLLAAKLNVAAFGIGEIEFADWDDDGTNETVNELLVIADVLFDSGTAAEQQKMATVLDKLNNEGHDEDLWFDPNCNSVATCD